MRRALDVAKCTPAGDVPVGAVLFDAAGKELATGVNRREQRADPTAHAEVEAIRQAVRVHGAGWRLSGCELVVTLEPCAMCAGAISHARIGRVVWAADDPKGGAVVHGPRVFTQPTVHHRPEVYDGIGGGEAAALLRDFFAARR